MKRKKEHEIKDLNVLKISVFVFFVLRLKRVKIVVYTKILLPARRTRARDCCVAFHERLNGTGKHGI